MTANRFSIVLYGALAAVLLLLCGGCALIYTPLASIAGWSSGRKCLHDSTYPMYTGRVVKKNGEVWRQHRCVWGHLIWISDKGTFADDQLFRQ